MKQLIIKALSGLAVAAGAYLLVFFALTQVELSGRPAIYWTSDVLFPKGGHAYQRFHEFNPEHQYDALIMGSSHAYRGYDPRLFATAGIDVFNLGSSSQTMLQTYYLAEAYARPENCKYVILDLYESALIGDGMESTADLSQNLRGGHVANDILLAQSDIRGINMWTLRNMMKRDSAAYLSNNYQERGYVITTDSVGPRLAYQEEGRLQSFQINYLEQLIKSCQERELTLVAVYSPLPTDYIAADEPSFDQQIIPLLNQYGIPFLDFRSNLPINNENHFYDQHHLNQAGVDIFNEYLIADLETMISF